MARKSRYFGSTLHERKKSLDSIKQMMKKSPPRAKGDLLRHLEKYPEDMYAWHYYGRINQETYNFDEAEYAFTKVADSNSLNRYAGIVGLADIARARGDRTLAKKYYYKAIEENPNESTRTYCLLARTEVSDANYSQAIIVLNASRIQDNSILLEKIKTYVAYGDIEKAKILINQIIPNNQIEERSIIHEQAKIAIIEQDITKAKYLLQIAKEYPIKDIDYFKILRTESTIAMDEKDYQLVTDNCEESLAYNQNLNGEVYILLGRTKQMMGYHQEAIKYYKLATLEPSATSSAKQASHLYAALQYLQLEDNHSAENELIKALKCNKMPYPAVVEVLCGIYYREGNYKKIKCLIENLRKKYFDLEINTLLDFINLIVDKKEGKTMPRRDNRIYRERQVVEYKKQDAIIHIINHHQTPTSKTNGNFMPSINISKLYDEILPFLTAENKVVSTDMLDKYIIDYPNIGLTNDETPVNKIGVVTLPETKDIITMYPDFNSYGIRKKDMKKEPKEEKPKQNRITKFNQKYSLISN